MHALKRFGNWIKGLFSHKQEIENTIVHVADYIVPALGVLDLVTTIAVSATPTKVDDIVYATVRTKYPKLFNGEIQTGEQLTQEVRLMIFGAAASALKKKFPELPDAVAKKAVAEAIQIKSVASSAQEAIVAATVAK
jgi:hypothetical protein